jgi:NADP-dependent 3-hydroxy acid dehydrogenase YdfG
MAAAVVIGAGPGIGAAVARRFAWEGLAVGLIARRAETLEATRATLGARALVAVRTADVADDAGLRAALDELGAELGPPELLVYNAALIRSDAPGELTTREHQEAWTINVVGAITAAAHLAPRMAAAGRGTILLTGGLPEPLPDRVSLSLGKAGVRALTTLLAERYGPSGVHVATVTVAGTVESGSAFDPDEIAGHYWRLHTQPRESWEREVIVTGAEPGGRERD